MNRKGREPGKPGFRPNPDELASPGFGQAIAASWPVQGVMRKHPGAMKSGLTGLTVGIAPVALCLAGCFIFQNAGGTVPVSQFALLGLGPGGSFRSGGLESSFRCNPVLLVKLRLFARRAAFVTGLRDLEPFGLLCFAGRFGSFPCSPV